MGTKGLTEHIQASRIQIEDDVVIGVNSILRGEEVVLERGARIGDNVEITCDALHVGPGCAVGSNTEILAPMVILEEGSSIGTSVHGHLNQYLHLGRFSIVSQNVRMVGQGIRLGEFVFLDYGVTIGGGGARGPRSFLTIGRRTSVFANSLINLSEEVTIGHSVGISFNVALLTHYAWQPVLKGYTARFAPISVADHATIYFNVIVLPGVVIGEWSTVGAGSIVVRDVPAHCLAVGNPARVVRGPEDYPRPLSIEQRDSLVREILADYLTTLEPKGARVIEDRMASEGYARVEFEGERETIRYVSPMPHHPPISEKEQGITLSLGSVPAELRGWCHFDLEEETCIGEPTRLAEDLRDYLRRRGIRIFTDKPFQSLPLASLQRLERRKSSLSSHEGSPNATAKPWSGRHRMTR